MAETFTGKIKLAVTGSFVSDTNEIASSTQSINYPLTHEFTNGTGADQANMFWSDQRTIAASGTDDLDLSGSLTNSFGTTVNFTSIKAIIVSAADGNTNDVLVGGDATAALAEWTSDTSDVVVVKPGGMFALVNPANGYAVTATTADILQIANSAGGTSVTYDILLIGEV